MSNKNQRQPLHSNISQDNLPDQPISHHHQAIQEIHENNQGKKKAIEEDNETICEDSQVLKHKSQPMLEKLEGIHQYNEVPIQEQEFIVEQPQAIQEIDMDDEDSYEQFTLFKNNFRIRNSTLIKVYWTLIFVFLVFHLHFISSEIIPVLFGQRQISPRRIKNEVTSKAYAYKIKQTLNFSEPISAIQTKNDKEKQDSSNSLSASWNETKDENGKLIQNISQSTLLAQMDDQTTSQALIDDPTVSQPQTSEEQNYEEFNPNPKHQISNLNSERIIDDMKLCFLLNAQKIEERKKQTEQKNLQVIGRLKMANSRTYHRFQDKLQVLKTIQKERLIDLQLIPLLLPWATTNPLRKFDFKIFILDIITKKYFHPGYKWLKLFQILEGIGQWQSVGRLIGVATFSQIPQTYRGRSSSVLLFIPSVITFYVPHDLNQTQVIIFQGVRVQYDLYLNTQSIILRDELGQLSIDLTEDQRRTKQPVKRVFYCQGELCSQFYSIVILKSKYPLRINHLKIQTVEVIQNPYQEQIQQNIQ